jgi:hypothetical protein
VDSGSEGVGIPDDCHGRLILGERSFPLTHCLQIVDTLIA